MRDSVSSVDVERQCQALEYPVLRADAAAAFSDVFVEAGDSELNLGVVISESGRDSFANPDELYAEVAESVDGGL